MMYYRVGLLAAGSRVWKWGSTPLNSMQAVGDFLRLSAHLPGVQVLIFCSTSLNQWEEQLAQQNQEGVSHTWTVAQFLQEFGLQASGSTDPPPQEAAGSGNEPDPPYQWSSPDDLAQ